MNVSIFGLGYVGIVTSACLARDGHTVTGVDVNEDKVKMVNSGKSPIVELGLSELLAEVITQKRLFATTSFKDAIETTDVSLICVGTPTASNGSVDLSHVFEVCEQIKKTIDNKGVPHTLILRSTIQPGTTEKCRELIGNTNLLHFAFNPEFLREGTAIRDFESAPFTIIGTDDPIAESTVRELYALVESKIIVTDFKIAEMIKYACNSWHAGKITFANEIGRISKSLGVDGRKVMEVVIQDTKLNVSAAYMRPGFAFGGSCLPKDVRGLIHIAMVNNVNIPMLNSLLLSNDSHINMALEQIIKTGKRKVSMLGLAFKNDTDDLRESAAVELAERLLGKGFDLKIFDSSVYEAKLMGSNKLFIESKLPHLTSLLSNDISTIINHAEIMVVTYGGREFKNIIDNVNKTTTVIDLSGLIKNVKKEMNYEGICW